MEQRKKLKRSRECNWTADEKAYLIECVNAHLSVIEDKGNDTVMVNKKREAWEDIKQKMWAIGCDREVGKIKQLWTRMKLAAKQAVKADRKPTTAASSSHLQRLRKIAKFRRDLIEERQRQVKQETPVTDDLHSLEVELFQRKIQHQQKLEANEEELHSLRVELLQQQIYHQKLINAQFTAEPPQMALHGYP